LPTPTPVTPILEFTSPDQTIVEGEYAILKWKAENVPDVFLNGKLVTGTQTAVNPWVTKTYYLTSTSTLTDKIKITVLKRETITFYTFPDGAYVPAGYILNGDEFKAKGVEFTIEEEAFLAPCEDVKKPAVGVSIDSGGTPYLTTFVPKVVPACDECAPDLCESAPLSLNFLKPSVSNVTITFLHPTNSAQAIIAGDKDPKEAPQNIKLKVTFPFTNITRIDIGLDEKQPPEVIKIEYQYISGNGT
jgi:hypothetical protein